MNIYLINQLGTDYYKIGITKKEPILRLNELKTANAEELKLVNSFKTKHSYKLESFLHAHYQTKRKHLEWFELTKQDVNEFNTICLKGEEIFSFLKTNNHFIS